MHNRGGEQKIKKFDLEIALKLLPFSLNLKTISSELTWEVMSLETLFSTRNENTKEMAIILVCNLFSS